MKPQYTTKEKFLVERLDDIPLLIALQQQIGIDEIIDQTIERHWLHQGLSIGQLVVGWNAFILSESDHRKVAVEDWAVDHQSLLSDLFSTQLRRTDFTDDRLGRVLSHLADDMVWHEIESRLWQQTVCVYRLTPERVRLDATRFSGYHTPNDSGLMQHGYNPSTPNLAQVKMMAASIDYGTSGHLLATEVVSGEQADDSLYLPVIRLLRQTLDEPGLLYIGDSKMSAQHIRAELARNGDFYLVPLAKVGEVPKLYEQCVQKIVSGTQTATLIYNTESKGFLPSVVEEKGVKTKLIAAGYETSRVQTAELSSGETYTWKERILVVRSLSEAEKEFATLENRISKATQALLALTPTPGRGHRQIRTEAELIEKAEAILKKYSVKDYLRYTSRREQKVKTKYIGPGRGSPKRKKRQIRTVRYQITQVIRDEGAIKEAFFCMGWKLYATNHSETDLPLDEAVKLYRAAPRIERHFHLFNDAPIGIEPIYVRNDDQIKGLVRLLSLCVRLLTLIEIVIRRYLSQHGRTLSGLYEGNPNRKTASPTAVRILRAFKGIQRVLPNKDSPYTTPLSPLQRQILGMLSINEAIYQTSQHEKNFGSTLGRKCSQVWTKISQTFTLLLNSIKTGTTCYQ